jgi:cytochrome c-type biogenesis protein CcmE
LKTRHKRIVLIVGGLVILGLVATLVLNAFQSNLVFFFSPTQVAAGEAPKGKTFRIGGLVKEGSIKREADGVTLRFVVTDTEKDLTVAYKGILPDLFREGKGAVAQGKLSDDGLFTASEVLAKHDENYMPPEASKALDDAGHRATVNKAAQTVKP